MAQINTGKVITGGLVGGLVLNVVDYLVNGVWLAEKWTAQTAKLNPNLDMMSSTSIATYVAIDFILGILIVWLYAAIRPRFGPGAGTGVKAAIAVWVPVAAINSTFVVSGVYGPKIIAVSVCGTLLGMLAGGNVGARMYKEE
jgi:hypothetical protein